MTSVLSGGVRDRIKDALLEAVRKVGVDGEVPDLELGRAKVPEHGDYASSAGLKLALVGRGETDLYLNTYPHFNDWERRPSSK